MSFDIGAVTAKVNADITNFKQGMDQAKSETEGLRNGLSKVGESIADFGKQAAIMTAGVVAGIGAIGVKAVQMAGNFEQSEIAFTTLLKDRGKAIEAIKAIEQDAKSTPYNLPDLIKANQLLVSAGVNTEDARTQIKNLGNAIAATGGGTAELNRMAANLQQIKAVGKAAAIDVKQFAFAGINIYDMLAKSTGKNVAEIKEMDISYEMLTKAFADASAEGGMFEGAMQNQSKSLQGVISNIQDVIGITLKDIAVNSGLFDGIKNGAMGVLGVIEMAAPKIQRVFAVLGNIFNYLSETLKGNDLRAELEEALGFFFGDNAKMVADFLIGLMGIFKSIGEWIANNQELVMTFLQGLGIALGVLLIVGTITALLTALLNPVVLVGLAIAALYTAWKTNFWGIRDVMQQVWEFAKNLFENLFKPMFELFVGWFTERWDFIKSMLTGVWEIIKGIIQVAWGIVYGIITTGLALLQGDWGRAWQQIKQMASTVWDGLKNIFNGAIDFIKGWGGMVLHNLTKPFEDAWNKIKELVQKIKDNLDFTKRHSPSVIDIINNGVKLANRAMENLDWNTTLSPNLAAAGIMGGATNSSVNQISISMAGAYIGSDFEAQAMGEKIGDSIIRKLQQNVKF